MPAEVLRSDAADRGPRVTNMELFFDLVYVFAITQVSEFLSEHLTGRGALQTLVLFCAVWWAWNYTAWATNWVDPERPLTALVMVVMMVFGLVMAAALPDAFEGRALPFAIGYVGIQVVRTGFVVWAFPRGDPMRVNNLRLLTWLAIAGAIWIAGAFVSGDARLIVWAAAALVDLAAPAHGFWLPGRGSLPIERWRLTGTHLAERYQLVLIIALGESLLRVGATFASEQGSFATDASFIVGFLLSAGLWASYFIRLAERGATQVATRADAARAGRSGYAYAHALMVAGVIVVAVAVRATIAHPREPAGVAVTAVLLGGPALYFAGMSVFERAIGLAAVALRPWVAIAVLAVVIVVAALHADALVVMACAAAVIAGFLGFVVKRPYHEKLAAGG